MIFLFLTLHKLSVVNPNNLRNHLIHFEKESCGIEREDKTMVGDYKLKNEINVSNNLLNMSLEIGKTKFKTSNEVLKKNKQKNRSFTHRFFEKFPSNQRSEISDTRRNFQKIHLLKIYSADKTNKKFRKKRSKSQLYIESSEYSADKQELNYSFSPISEQTTKEVSQSFAFDEKKVSSVTLAENNNGELPQLSTFYEKEVSIVSITKENSEKVSTPSIVKEIENINEFTTKKNSEKASTPSIVPENKNYTVSRTKKNNDDVTQTFVEHVFNRKTDFFYGKCPEYFNDKSDNKKIKINFINAEVLEKNEKFVNKTLNMIENYLKMKDSLSALIECKIFFKFEVTILMLEVLNKKTGLVEYIHNSFSYKNLGFEFIENVELCDRFFKDFQKKHPKTFKKNMTRNKNFLTYLLKMIEKLEKIISFNDFQDYKHKIESYNYEDDELRKNEAKIFERSCSKDLNNNILKKMRMLPDSKFFKNNCMKEFLLYKVYYPFHGLNVDYFGDKCENIAKKLQNINKEYSNFERYKRLIKVILDMIKRSEKYFEISLNENNTVPFDKKCKILLKTYVYIINQENIINQETKIYYLNLIHKFLNEYNFYNHPLKTFDNNCMENYNDLETSFFNKFSNYLILFSLLSLGYFIRMYIFTR